MKKIFIIAEIGINHNGDIEIAKKLIDKSKEAGCGAVKFQKRDIETVYTKEFLDSPRESQWGKTQRDQKYGLELSKENYITINDYAHNVGLYWFASAWDLKSLKFLEQVSLKYNKVASAMLCHIDFLEAVAKQGKHTFISVGMASLKEIADAIAIFIKHKCPYELMHCNSQYPAPDSSLNLRCINTLRETFFCDVGYSCHSSGILPPALAIAYGATSIEKHITLDRTMYGSDQAASVEPTGFKKMVEFIRFAEIAIGDGYKTISENEQKIAAKLRRYSDV